MTPITAGQCGPGGCPLTGNGECHNGIQGRPRKKNIYFLVIRRGWPDRSVKVSITTARRSTYLSPCILPSRRRTYQPSAFPACQLTRAAAALLLLLRKRLRYQVMNAPTCTCVAKQGFWMITGPGGCGRQPERDRQKPESVLFRLIVGVIHPN